MKEAERKRQFWSQLYKENGLSSDFGDTHFFDTIIHLIIAQQLMHNHK